MARSRPPGAGADPGEADGEVPIRGRAPRAILGTSHPQVTAKDQCRRRSLIEPDHPRRVTDAAV
jgi:hypothetical protein